MLLFRGFNFGEGIIECLYREFMEELNTKIEVAEHYYTTDYFQPTTLIAEEKKLISIYYKVKLLAPINFTTKENPFVFDEAIEGAQIFRWVKINELNENDITFPIDKKVLGMLKQQKL